MDAYIYAADIYCEDCAESFTEFMPAGSDTGDSDDYPQGPYPDGGGEADGPQHCGSCGEFLENPLTEDGENYVRDETIGAGGDIPHQWREFYSYLFEGEQP